MSGSMSSSMPSSRRGSIGQIRKSSFLMELQDELHQQFKSAEEEERFKEVQRIRRILQKSPESRDPIDIDVLYEWVLQNGSTNKIFQDAQDIICKTICREMTLLELPAKGVVCYQGDYGDTFFIIITGSVSLFLDSRRRLILANEESGIQDRGDLRLLYEHTDGEMGATAKPVSYGTFIKQIGEGGTFGELAVIDPTARRSCTIICDVPTSFICLKRAAYQRLIRITNSSHLDFTQVEFLETLYFFDGWPHGELTRLSNRLRHLNFPANSYLTRMGSEANVVYFIYAGVVQESVPLFHHPNANGTVYKCTRVENDSSKRSIGTETNSKDKQQLRRIALELNLYQDHDICGEYPIFFNKPLCNTDLIAVTDVKTLIMDRDTWRELFFMHGLEHIRISHNQFKMLAETRENWRKTRIKIALANPEITLTLSTKTMMHDGKCICGWCGSTKHITGDFNCPAMIAAKKKQADKKKQAKRGGLHEIGAKAHAVKNTLTFVATVAESTGIALQKETDKTPTSPSVTLDNQRIEEDVQLSPQPSLNQTGRCGSLHIVAKNIVSGDCRSSSSNQEVRKMPMPPTAPQTPPDGGKESQRVMVSRRNLRNSDHIAPRKGAISDFPALAKASNKLYAYDQKLNLNAQSSFASVPKVEEVRKSAFTDDIVCLYKQEMVKKMKRLSTLNQYYSARIKILEDIQHQEAQIPEERYALQVQMHQRKPKIPKQSRRLIYSKTREPRPDRFNRKINRALKKLWIKDNPLPVVEESLKDF